MKKFLSIMLMLCIMLTATGTTALAASNYFGWRYEDDNMTYPYDVEEDMRFPDYWKHGAPDFYEVKMTKAEIRVFNDTLVQMTDKTGLVYLDQVTNLPEATIDYIDGIESSKIDMIRANRQRFGEIKYAVAVKRAELKTVPYNDRYLDYNQNLPDVLNQNAILDVNEPFVISEVCSYEGKTFYYGRSNNCYGWVDSMDVAICASREEWLDAWKVDIEDDNFIVVCEDQFDLEPMLWTPNISETEVFMGTVLKMVPRTELPRWIGEREGSWFNWVVYMPVRNDAGMYEKTVALVPANKNISIGFLPLTKSNIVDIAFCQLGNRFGFGGMLKSYDSPLYPRMVYKCFGFELPRYAPQQREMPHYVDVTNMSAKEKRNHIVTLPTGSLIFLKGRYVAIKLDTEKEIYVISDCSMVSDCACDGALDVRQFRDVMVTSLHVRRSNGNTWYDEIIGTWCAWDYDENGL